MLHLRKNEEALKCFDKILHLDPDFTEAQEGKDKALEAIYRLINFKRSNIMELTAASEAFVIIYHENMKAARHFYENILKLKLREVTYDWFVGYWISDKRETTLCISSSLRNGKDGAQAEEAW